ncbi:MAG: hypothetical protein KF725_00260 [Cyclobacteriaceae bacterium]|nr:hypothetical protein [Cyclobacteriaceae bacterium]UYN87100.1 MAG: hypothetical protein KIT51_02145 [Cyclobacteriaceae bacterium]
MKTLSLEKMEGVEGGMPTIDICGILAWAVLVSNGIPFGTVEAVIIFELAYNSCLYQY